jgi:hypothetical protein
MNRCTLCQVSFLNYFVAPSGRYWIKILINSGVVTEQKFTPMLAELNKIIKILISSINKLKQKEN